MEDTKLFVSHRFAKKLIAAKVCVRRLAEPAPPPLPAALNVAAFPLQIAFKLHVIVGPTDTDSVTGVILKKAQVGPTGHTARLPWAADRSLRTSRHACPALPVPVQDVDAQAIVMARHSKGKLREMWVGSVTKAVVHRSSIPVAVVPHAL